MNRERVLLHQIHPAKLGTDIAADIASTTLLWRHHLASGILVRLIPPVLASAIVLRYSDVAALAGRPAGKYVMAHMPPGAQAVRLAGDLIMTLGAWRRQPWVLAAGLLVVLVGWSHGLLPSRGVRD